MRRFFLRLSLPVVLFGTLGSASAFSLLGPLEDWQVQRIGYTAPAANDIGGPKNLGEEYRWNIRTITYGFDSSFVNYFGQRGVREVEKAMGILNALRPLSSYSSNLSEFPTDSTHVNQRASSLGLADLKSYALATLMEEMGLASPDRYVWTLRNRAVINGIAYYSVIKRNFDPMTLVPSSYVNDTLYTYGIFEFGPILWADAVEVPVDPLAIAFTAVASGIDGAWSGIGPGEFYTGLTRDDVGGLRYIYRKKNLNVEGLLAGTTGTVAGPWTPVGSVADAIDVATRPGAEKIVFKRAAYSAGGFGPFITFTNRYVDLIITNSSFVKQRTQRVLTQPDILFAADDLGVTADGSPFSLSRSVNWLNNDLLNGQATLAGPGVIQPQVIITFNSLGPVFANNDSDPAFLDELGATRNFIWGSFDGTTNEPVVYPIGTSIYDLENRVFRR